VLVLSGFSVYIGHIIRFVGGHFVRFYDVFIAPISAPALDGFNVSVRFQLAQNPARIAL